MQHLSIAQQQFMASIVSYGQSINAGVAEIMAARDIAFDESSLGTNTNNGVNDATGPFQYLPSTWNQEYPQLNINSPTDQINAAFQEIMAAAAMYYPLSQSNPSVYDFYSLSDYADAIHIYSLGRGVHPSLSQLKVAHGKMTKALTALGNLSLFTKASTLQINEAGQGAEIGYGQLSFSGFSGFGSYYNPGVEIIIEDNYYTDAYGNNHILNGTEYQQQQP